MHRRRPPDHREEDEPAGQRLDLWLWFARVARTRRLAAELAASGHVRVNRVRLRSPGKTVKVGDVLTISLSGEARVLRIVAFAERRGPYREARQLYDDLSESLFAGPGLNQ